MFLFSMFSSAQPKRTSQCLHVLRTLRKEQYNQAEIDLLFKAIVLPNLTYGLSVYGASEPDLNIVQTFLDTVEPRFNEPLYNELLGITNEIFQPGQSYIKMYGTEPRYNEILVITNTIHNPKRKMYLDITNKCQHATKDEVVFSCLRFNLFITTTDDI